MDKSSRGLIVVVILSILVGIARIVIFDSDYRIGIITQSNKDYYPNVPVAEVESKDNQEVDYSREGY